jgi:hypothetical protein
LNEGDQAFGFGCSGSLGKYRTTDLIPSILPYLACQRSIDPATYKDVARVNLQKGDARGLATTATNGQVLDIFE